LRLSVHPLIDRFVLSIGVVNRGDSFRRRRSRSNSLAPADQENEERRAPPKEVISYNVAMLGARGVGKTALISQFMTSECINAYDRQRGGSPEGAILFTARGEIAGTAAPLMSATGTRRCFSSGIKSPGGALCRSERVNAAGG